jgi:UDP-N-acetylmuramoyl-L-alanyl-D-glutamate--2,6-diaminopimelate ligase
MMLLQLLDGIPVTKILQMAYGKKVQTEDVTIRKVTYDSRSVGRGDLFVAIRGLNLDGHRFIENAVHQGARAVILEDDRAVSDSFFLHNNVTKVVVGNSRRALARISANYFGHPSKKLQLLGVTGTNGKTTSTHLLKSILESTGEKVGLIGTIEYRVGKEVIPAVHTTPESLELNELLDSMLKNGCRSVVMEVSSHALALERVYGFEFQLALFTNFTQDHLDFHGTMEAYFAAKKMLFDGLSEQSLAVTNLDDERGLSIVSGTKARLVTYGFQKRGDVTVRNAKVGIDGISLDVLYDDKSMSLTSPLNGRFNVYNLLGVTASALALGIGVRDIQRGVENVRSVRGRFERIASPEGWNAIIDYAHTPDALRKVLESIREMKTGTRQGRIITIFGCGGNRDREKRPQMGKVASELSDVTIVTSDNPRHENPESIVDEILKGIQSGTKVLRIVDRREAIVAGLEMAQPGDVVLIAGKGHETYQILGDEKIHFDDREVVEAHLGKLKS